MLALERIFPKNSPFCITLRGTITTPGVLGQAPGGAKVPKGNGMQKVWAEGI